MSGIAIKVPNVDWSANNLGKVTFLNDGSGEVSGIALDLYNSYITKSGRSQNNSLLLLIDALVKAGLHEKCTGLFYLASSSNNLEHIKYSVIDLRELSVSGTPLVTSKGVKSNNSGHFIDKGYDFSSKGLLASFIISEEGTTYTVDWGRDMGSAPTLFSSYGGYQSKNDIIKWSNSSAVSKNEDTATGIGVFSVYVKATALIYKHGEVSLNKTVPNYTGTSWAPTLLNYPSITSRSTATMKMYATFNNDLTESEVSTIHQIFKNFDSLL